MSHTLVCFSTKYSVCKSGTAPAVSVGQPPLAVCFAAAEWTTVCPTDRVPANADVVESGWSCFMVQGPLPFDLVGVLADLLAPLRAENIPVFVVSTFSTDYILVKSDVVTDAIRVLAAAGHTVVEPVASESPS